MGSIRSFNLVKLFAGALVSDRRLIAPVKDRLTALYGTIDRESPVIEIGGSGERIFFSFERLIDADQLVDIKRQTNELEEEIGRLADTVKRPANLDPGYIEHAKVVRASTKNVYHRIYLGRGIFAEVTMHFKNDILEFLPWTHADYQLSGSQEFFRGIRHSYRGQLKTMCILNREEPQ